MHSCSDTGPFGQWQPWKVRLNLVLNWSVSRGSNCHFFRWPFSIMLRNCREKLLTGNSWDWKLKVYGFSLFETIVPYHLLPQRNDNWNVAYQSSLRRFYYHQCAIWLSVKKPMANQNKVNYFKEPMRTRSKNNQTYKSAGIHGRLSRDWLSFYIWLVERAAKVSRTNHRAK